MIISPREIFVEIAINWDFLKFVDSIRLVFCLVSRVPRGCGLFLLHPAGSLLGVKWAQNWAKLLASRGSFVATSTDKLQGANGKSPGPRKRPRPTPFKCSGTAGHGSGCLTAVSRPESVVNHPQVLQELASSSGIMRNHVCSSSRISTSSLTGDEPNVSGVCMKL